MKLTEKEASRYNRQILLNEIGETGQLLLKQARVLIVGVGGLGSPIALYLAGAGVGTIGLIDDDTVSETNLQRQVLYSEPEIGLSKAEQAKLRLQALNSDIRVEAWNDGSPRRMPNASLPIYDTLVDGCDISARATSLTTPAYGWTRCTCTVPSASSTGKSPCSTTRAVPTTAPSSPTKKKCSPCPTPPRPCWVSLRA